MSAQRMVLFTFAAFVGAGIWLTGFDKASWVLYIPLCLSVFAGITGICPSLIFWKKCGLK
jgi:hypothetical protein